MQPVRRVREVMPQRRDHDLASASRRRELWFIRKPKVEESFLAMAIMGIVLIQNLTMLEVWDQRPGLARDATGITNKAVIFTPAFAIAILAPVALLAVASWIARVPQPRNAPGRTSPASATR